MGYRRVILTMGLGLLCFGLACGQSVTRVRGKVTDASTGEPLRFVGVSFPGTSIGTSTDTEGVYSLETRESVSQINARFLSYESLTYPVTQGAFNAIDFALTPVINEIDVVVVRPGENPAHAILDSISRYKYRNDPDRKDSYRYSTYTKMELDLVSDLGFRPSHSLRGFGREFGFIFDYIDTLAATGSPYLPMLISESHSDYYYRKNPRLNREIIRASRISGIDDANFAQFTGGLYVNVNLYDNYINFFDVNIPSPLNEHGRTFYNYYLIDSMDYGGRKTYHIRFHPKNLGSPVFNGEVYIDAGEWALRSAKMQLASGVDVNWISGLTVENTNERISDSTWFRKSDRIVAEFSMDRAIIGLNGVRYMAQRQIEYSDVRFNEPIPEEVVRLRNNTSGGQNALRNDDEYWAQVRPYELTEKEAGIYRMVDSIKNAPAYRRIYDLLNTLTVGYQKAGPIEVGALYSLLSFNKLEGTRPQLNVRTNKDFSEKIRLSVYGAYGFKDREWKGGGSVEYLFSALPTRKLTLSGKHDVLQLSAGSGLFAHGNILSSMLSRGDTERLVMQNQLKAHYEQEWNPGLTNTLSFEWRELMPTRFVDFTLPDGASLPRVRATEITLGTRFSHNEIVHRRPFDKIYMRSDFPVVDIELTAGLKDASRSGDEYYRAVTRMDFRFNVPPLGRSRINATAGKIVGTVPYPFLKMHEGNATYFYEEGAFSCMDFYEFASDTWASILYEHHFRGFFLGRIPLMKKLQWREVFICKALWGTLSGKNDGSFAGHRAYMNFPTGMSSVSKPYIETGVGIENIFRFCRLDAVWRITHRDNRRKTDNFTLNFSMHFDF